MMGMIYFSLFLDPSFNASPLWLGFVFLVEKIFSTNLFRISDNNKQTQLALE